MFFRDVIEAVSINRKRENEKTQLLSKHCKTVIFPNRLHETVDKWIKYQAKYSNN
jgi:hypothetical protein